MNMSLLKVVSKKVHKSAYIRKKLTNRLKLAVTLIVTRGAQAGTNEDGQPILTFDDEKAGHHLIMGGACAVILHGGSMTFIASHVDWTYTVTPQLETYRMPYPQLVEDMRDALKVIFEKAKKLEEYWARQNKRFGNLDDIHLLAERSKAKQFPQKQHLKAAEKVHPLASAPRRRAIRGQLTAIQINPNGLEGRRMVKFFDEMSIEAPQAAVSGGYMVFVTSLMTL